MAERRVRRRGAAPCAAGVAAIAILLATGAAASPVFELADRSDLVLQATVERAKTVGNGSLRVYSLKPARVLKGAIEPGAEVALVQEMLFASTRPYFEQGVTTLVFAVPLPNYSAYRAALPEGSYLRWTERLDVAASVGELTDPLLVAAVERYLAVRDDPGATARHLAASLAGGSPRLRQDALATLEARDELVPLLEPALLADLREVLADPRVPPVARGELLVRLGRMRAPGVVPLAEEVLARDPGLRAAALDALVSSDRLPDETQLVAYSRADDTALRLAAARGLAKAATDPALDRLEAMLEHDPDATVQLAILSALGEVRHERAVGLLASALGDDDRTRVHAAADALGRLGTKQAVQVLTAVLMDGAPHAQTVAAFALRQSGDVEAVKFLLEQKETHPDPDVRRACTLALGQELPHEH